MFEIGLIESTRKKAPTAKLLTFPVACAFHAVALGLIIVAQIWAVESVPEPLLQVVLYPTPFPVPQGGGDGNRGSKPVAQKTRVPVVQPTVVPETARSDAPPVTSIDPADGTAGTPAGGVGQGGPGCEGCPVVGPNGPTGPVLRAEPAAPVQIDGRIDTPVLVDKVGPVYPEIARHARRQGIVVVEAVINRDGNVADAHVLADRVGYGCGAAALDAVRQWRYRPATWRRNHEPVSVYLYVTVRFELQ